MTLDDLVRLVSAANSPPGPRGPGEGGPNVCVDSRLVGRGDIFVALAGTACDGHDFIDQAVANGVRYVVCQSGPALERREGMRCETIVVEDCSEAAGLLSQAAAGNPAAKLINLAVTGTNGKTTVAFLVRSVIREAGSKCGLVGTVTYDTCSGKSCEATLTTPDCTAIAQMTAQMVENGAEYMVIEASSHALSQNRLAGLDFKAAAFTNLAGDHLDYHKTEEDYLAAKTRLFNGLTDEATAVLNKQSPHAKVIAQRTEAGILWYGIAGQATGGQVDITAHINSMDTSGTIFVLEYAGQRQKVVTPLVGLYNVSNCLAAAGLCLTGGFDLATVAGGLSALQTIPGRLEKVDWPGDFTVLIDYAHTDDALKNVLATLKPLCEGRLIVVFGCGGDRDRTKRPRMARVAEQYGDLVVVTSDNPRTERPEEIISEIVAGFEKGPPIPSSDLRDTSDERRATKTVEPDRKKAIRLAIEAAEKDDIVLIAGKGHETYQIIGTKKFHFSDREIAREYLKKRT
ncbi:MAG: UDP-N-acetylmuramoyl-L-alanyl-D-glutamate--2,6-diaminopimelate ligase [Phycisphaerae bacterium]|nr:UDP-N-acetylmuramoyl-L-alanyl-D-glutamate--2,6-diaminopimelate ligase [Phycisphaerae bacterium]